MFLANRKIFFWHCSRVTKFAALGAQIKISEIVIEKPYQASGRSSVPGIAAFQCHNPIQGAIIARRATTNHNHPSVVSQLRSCRHHHPKTEMNSYWWSTKSSSVARSVCEFELYYIKQCLTSTRCFIKRLWLEAKKQRFSGTCCAEAMISCRQIGGIPFPVTE